MRKIKSVKSLVKKDKQNWIKLAKQSNIPKAMQEKVKTKFDQEINKYGH